MPTHTVAPGLRRQPLHGVVAILGVAGVLHGERHPVALGAVAAARVHGDHGVPSAHVALESRLWAVVRRAQQDSGEPAIGVGAKHVRRHLHAVAHRYLDVGLSEDS